MSPCLCVVALPCPSVIVTDPAVTNIHSLA
jgi:hypothetical protein